MHSTINEKICLSYLSKPFHLTQKTKAIPNKSYKAIQFCLELIKQIKINKVKQDRFQLQYNIQRTYQFEKMRNSPINNIRARGDYSSSPYESNVRNRSPARDPSNYSPDRIQETSETEYWRTRAKALENELLAINEQLMLQMRKNERINDLQDKIELLLAQNTHFVDQNENLIRLLQQKNEQTRLLKQKLDHQYNHSNIAEAQKKKVFDHLNIKDQEHQLQIDKLVAQINRLHDQMVDMENMKQIEISQLKNKYENEAMNQIQTLKRSQFGNNELQQLNIRKLKDEIEEKNFELQNMRRQSKLQAERLNGEISFLKNEIKKIQNQKDHELNMIKTENQNAKNNLIRAHRKNEEELKNLHQTKLKRLSYELEERKNEVDEIGGRLRKTGKENENDLNRLTGEKGKMRVELKENDVRNNQRIKDLTNFYETQLQQQRDNHLESERNLRDFYTNEINSLKEVIEAKEQEIRRLLEINRLLKENEEKRLADIAANNNELKRKIEELVLHYERELELMKIKISQLYEADIEALRSMLQNNMSAHNRETENLRMLLRDVREELAGQVHAKLELRKEYDNRLNEFKIKYEREHQQLQDLIMLHEKQVENQTSKISMSQIEYTQTLQSKAVDTRKMIAERRQLETQIANKNREIEALNLRIQKMTGFHRREISKLQEQIQSVKNDHQKWLENQDRQTLAWNAERADFKEKIHRLNLDVQDSKNKNKTQEEDFLEKISDKNLKISSLQGELDEARSKTRQLQSKVQVEVENIEKTYLDTQALMNVQKERWLDTSSKQKQLMESQFSKQRSELQTQIDDLKRENDLLKDNYEKGKIREAELKTEISGLLDSVNQRSQLEERVINIGLCNNYFKNVAEIFKKTVSL